MKRKKLILIVGGVVLVLLLLRIRGKLPSNFSSLTLSQKIDYLAALGNAGSGPSPYE